MPIGQTDHLHTPVGIEIARQGRARRIAKRPDVKAPQVFVVRHVAGFGWEIRRYGNIVLSRSVEAFGSLLLARSAGQKALAKMPVEAEI